jgi:hypothetical protein
MLHYMIDIETLGQGPESMVLSIAAVKFDQDKVIKSIELYPCLTEQHGQGQKIDIYTLMWWEKNREILSNYLATARKSLNFCYYQLAFFLYEKGDQTQIWTKSPRFDLQILENLWKNHPHLWDYRSQGDVRAAEFKLRQKQIPLVRPEQSHNSLSDCLAQVQNLQKFLQL